ncbi:MAG: hypothetical protein JRE58_01675 [Deltaproteobacteria bacterium]|nr:hypothetical protein [Deltaproteobacteria bacterium]
MSGLIQGDPWVWVIVQNDGVEEQFVGLHDKQAQTDYIPCFLKKDQALECFINMPRERGMKYEAQAVLYTELVLDSAAGGFMIHLLNDSGEILEKIDPKHVAAG